MKTTFRVFILSTMAYFSTQEELFDFIVIREMGEQNDFDFVNTTSWNVKVVYLNASEEDRPFLEVYGSTRVGRTAVIDTRAGGGTVLRDTAKQSGTIYIRARAAVGSRLAATLQYAKQVFSIEDAAFIFKNRRDLDYCLQYMIDKEAIRMIALHGLNSSVVEVLKDMRPTPSAYIMFADTQNMKTMFNIVSEVGLVTSDHRWQLVFTDFDYNHFDTGSLRVRTILMTTEKLDSCADLQADCSTDAKMAFEFFRQLFWSVYETVGNMTADESYINKITNCSGLEVNASFPARFYGKYKSAVFDFPLLSYSERDATVSHNLKILAYSAISGVQRKIGEWKHGQWVETDALVRPLRRLFRIGTGYSVPLAYPVTTKSGEKVWNGYCIDLIRRLSMDMDFDYKLVTSYDFGRRLRNGTWTGLVGLLAGGKIDIIVGALTVTSKREEVIDFITPYFLHTGIGIVIRRPSHGKSLFKFMTVFRGEVWLSILSAITATTLMIWLLDKYSPYSSRNITNKYHKRCRKFSLKESFWFAVTSFTPQGGGELPNCLSARILVGAYWIFVVLVLATFTANLAAFLTVEQIELQSPVKSLEQLSKQSRIKYTVVKNSIAHTYIKNMKIAEEMLYKMWEKIAINYSCHGLEVWDYPVKEQFGGMLAAIEKTKFVPSFKEGIQKVLMNEDAGFSLIHDAVEIKYHIQKYCKLTTIGEPFAKRPYAIAVQQGSRWTQELARRLLELQKIRFFESLHLKYWNITKSKCNSLQENEGISLQSLGGVFIATLSGLLLSVISLCVEVIFKKRNKINMKTFKPPFKQNVYPDLITDKEFGLGFIKKTVLEEFIFQ